MKVLILAYDFPPLISIGGLRPASWYKYFAEFGVDVTVVTWDWEYEQAKNGNGAPVVSGPAPEAGNKRALIKVRFSPGVKDKIANKLNANKFPAIRKGITYLFSFLEFLNLKLDVQAPLYYEADKLLQNERFDFIIATGKPFILFRYAALLSKKHNTPWIADYRDSWTLNHLQSDYSLSPLSFVLNSFYKIMERRYVSTASTVTTVAPSYIEFLPHFAGADKFGIVYNGYDDEAENLVAGLPLPESKFIISYAGIIYPMQNLEVFLEAVCIFLKENVVKNDEFEMHFWGVDSRAVERLMNYRPDLQKYIHIHNKVSYFEVMKALSYSHMLLLLTTASDSWLNAKLFDYLVLKRPVLMVGKDTNIMSGILKETNGGIVAENAADAASAIASGFRAYKQAAANDTVNYKQYSRRNQTEQLYVMLKDLLLQHE